ncbi:MAG: cell division protein FtsQ/DivIB [Thiohalorhabdus sp.]|uniref:cell division protein FtsQ/DivIB n=1 Tax=Thiohalorhabdus sp. TaxID=3094134 RepID=UPI003980DEBF
MPRRRRDGGRRRLPVPRLRYGFLGAGALGGAVWLAGMLDDTRDWFDRQTPVRKVAVGGDLRHTDPEALARWLGDRLRGGFFTVDLSRMKEELEARPWVRSARIGRQWPDTLRVRVAEHRPQALWSDGGPWFLVSREGTVFKPRDLADGSNLPRLSGPRDRLGALLDRLDTLRDPLESHRVSRLQVDARGAWSAEVDGRILLRFGRRNWERRLDRFLRVEREWSLLDRPVRRIDLRYPDGLAVAPDAEAGQKDRSATEHPPNQG